MQIETYAQLKATVVDFVNRAGDPIVEAQADLFVQLADKTIRRRVGYNSIRDTLVIDDAAVAYPEDMKAPRSLRLVTGSPSQDMPIEFVTPDALAEHRARNSPTGRPRFASAIAGEFLFVPAPDQDYDAELIYYNKVTPLSDVNDTNEILQDAPDAYLYGALLHASPYLEHDERIPVWKEKFDAAIFELKIAKDDEEYGASLRPARQPVAY